MDVLEHLRPSQRPLIAIGCLDLDAIVQSVGGASCYEIIEPNATPGHPRADPAVFSFIVQYCPAPLFHVVRDNSYGHLVIELLVYEIRPTLTIIQLRKRPRNRAVGEFAAGEHARGSAGNRRDGGPLGDAHGVFVAGVSEVSAVVGRETGCRRDRTRQRPGSERAALDHRHGSADDGVQADLHCHQGRALQPLDGAVDVAVGSYLRERDGRREERLFERSSGRERQRPGRRHTQCDDAGTARRDLNDRPADAAADNRLRRVREQSADGGYAVA